MSTAEALRCLKRRLARIVYNHLITDQATATATLAAAA
jgi:transposase